MAGIELLDTDQKAYVIDLLNKFFPKGNEKINSCLILLYTSKSSDIYKSLDIQKYRKILNLNKNLFASLKYEGDDIEIISSDISGVGKSTQIKKEIEDKKKKYIYFPFGGVIKRKDIYLINYYF